MPFVYNTFVEGRGRADLLQKHTPVVQLESDQFGKHWIVFTVKISTDCH